MTPIWISASRSRAATRALVWAAPAVLLGVITVSVYGGLNFVPTGVSNRLVEISLALVTLPVPLGAAVSAMLALRWLLLALWPGRVGFEFRAQGTELRLGPFGVNRYAARTLEVRYPFELAEDAEDATFESFVPADEQRATLLPRIRDRLTGAPLNRTILKFARGDERQLASQLRPVIDAWRGEATDKT